jgi:hypothetical protein
MYRTYKPATGSRPVKSIGVHDVAKMMGPHRLGQPNARPITANRAKAILSKMLKRAVGYAWRELGPSPCAYVEGNEESTASGMENRRSLQPSVGSRTACGMSHSTTMRWRSCPSWRSPARPSELGRTTPQMVGLTFPAALC